MLLLLSLFAKPDLAVGAATAPQIVQQPLGQTVGSGTPVSLQVQASGTAPLAYQWFRNSLTLSGETNSTLTLTNGSVLNAGSYFVVVTNVAGSATSTVARVRVDEALTFRVLALRTNGFVALEANQITGDDRGGMAVSANSVFLTGDTATGRWRKQDLATASRTGQRYIALISDLQTEKAYALANDVGPLTTAGTFTALAEFDDAGVLTGNRINISTPLTIDSNLGSTGFFAGYGRVVIVIQDHAFNIDIPSGNVTDLGFVDTSFHHFSEDFTFSGFWGLAEYFNGDVFLVYAQDSATIVRTRVRNSITTELARFGDTSGLGISDMASFTFSPSLSRWFFHYEGSGVFGSRDETIGWAKAVFTRNPDYPEIVQQPFGTTVFAGTPIALSVVASGDYLSYQWRLNGTDIFGATNSVLAMANPQVSDSGEYTVIVSNPVGTLNSLPAEVTIRPVTPLLTGSPKDQVSFPGGSVMFSLIAEGPPPLSYQWKFNDTPIPSETNTSLMITNVGPAQLGAYSVQVTNQYGAVSSAPAQLTLLNPLPENATFRVLTLKTNNAQIVDDAAVISFDLGGIATTLNRVFYEGQIGTASFEIQDLSNATRVNRNYNSLISDLRTGTAYVFARNTTPVDWNSGSANSLIELDPAGQPGRRIPLSSTIAFPQNFNGNIGFFSGYTHALVFNTTNFYNVALPSGVVTDLGPFTNAIPHSFSQSWAYWGIAENSGGINSVVYVRNNGRTISRIRVSDGATNDVATFSQIGQMAVISASLYRNRWYFHYPNSTLQFGGTNDTLGFADAVFEIKQADHYEFSQVASPQVINQPIPLSISAKDANNRVVTNFSGTITISGVAVAGGGAIAVNPTVASNFIDGVWTGQVTVAQSSPGMFLKAADDTGSSGTSASFTVLPLNDLFVAVSTSPGAGVAGQPLTYSLMVSNTGPGIAHGVLLTNVLPPEVVYQSVNSSVGSCANTAGTIRCDLGDIGSAAATVTIGVVTPTIGLITNLTTISRAEADTFLPNNAVTLVTAVNLPALTIEDVSGIEGNSGTNFVNMNVRLNAPATNTVTVNYSMFNGTATANVDFVFRNGSLTFLPGSTNQVISLGIRGDTLWETNEVFSITLNSAVNAVVAKGTATCTIINDDPAPVLSIGNATVNEGNIGGTNSARFEVRISARTGLQIQVAYATTNGTAQAGTDYTAASGIVTFAAGSLAQTQAITIPIVGDTIAESNEVFYVILSAVSNAIPGNLIGTGTIVNEDGFGVLDHFSFAPISSPQLMNLPVSVVVMAKDFFETTITNFNSAVRLGAAQGRFDPTNNVLAGLEASSSGSGDYTLGWSFLPTQDITITHLRHYFGTKISFWTDTGDLIRSQPVSSIPGTWTETPLNPPLTLSGGTVYRVATYTGNGNYYYNFSGAAEFAYGSIVASYDGVGDSFPTFSDSVRWWLVDFRYGPGLLNPIPAAPTNSTSFTNGVWAGEITLFQSGTNINFRALDSVGHGGISDDFNVLALQVFEARVALDGVHVQARALPNRTYELLAADNLTRPVPPIIASATSDANGVVELVDPAGATRPARFYRVRLANP